MKMETNTASSNKWKKRTELPVYKQLTQFQFDPKLLVEAYEEYIPTRYGMD